MSSTLRSEVIEIDAPFMLGLAVAFLGAVLLASGSEMQSRAVFQSGGRWLSFLRSPRWLIGLLLLGVAVSTNFVALALAPVSAVQAMSVIALAASAAYSGLMGRVSMTRANLLSVLVCILGVLGFIAILAAHPSDGPSALAAPQQLVIATTILATLSALGLGAVILGRNSRSVGLRFFGLFIGAMTFGSITTVFKVLVSIVLARGFAAALTDSNALFGLGVIAIGGVVANVLLQRSHYAFPAPVVVAALTTIDPVTAAVIGITVIGEAALTVVPTSGLILCGVTACIGVIGVSQLTRTDKKASNPEASTTRDLDSER